MRQLIVLVLLFWVGNVAAQDRIEIKNSGELIKQGIKLHEEGQFIQALALYNQVPENDTNYQLACYEAALSARLAKKWDEVASAAKNGYNRGKGIYNLDLLANLGSALDEQGKYKEAEVIFDSMIKTFPLSPVGYYNKGLCYTLQGKYQEAEDILQKAITINPYSPGGHFYYGYNHYEAGDVVPAYLAFCFALATNPEDYRKQKIISYLLDIAMAKDSFLLKHKKQFKFKNQPDFKEAEEVVLGQLVFSDKYELRSSFDEKLIRQLQAIVDLNRKPKGEDFFSQYYLTFYDLIGDKHFEPFSYHIASGLDIKQVKSYLSKNKRDYEACISFISECLQKIGVRHNYKNWPAEKNIYKGYHYSKGKLVSEGDFNIEKQEKNGEWKFFYGDGNLKEVTRYTNDKANGPSKSYYHNGNVEYEVNYVNDKISGSYKHYYENGNLNYEMNIRDDKKSGPYKIYYASGALKEEGSYDAGELNGSYIEYYRNGNKLFVATYKKGKYTGDVTRYYANGVKELEYTFRDGKKSGPYTRYYLTGNIEEKGTYEDDEYTGKVTEYHYNGKIKEERNYVGGKLSGEVISYDEAGNKTKVANYAADKKEGISTYYNVEGKKYCEEHFSKGNYKQINYFNPATGELIKAQDVTKRGTTLVEVYDQAGIKIREVNINKDGYYDGYYKSFFENGKLQQEKFYKAGNEEGGVITYYINGKKSYDGNYKDGKEDGYFRYYYDNGKLRNHGNYVDGEQENVWISYERDGSIDEESYYISGSKSGTETSYFLGKKFKTSYVIDDVLMKEVYFDTLGNEIRTVQIFNQPEAVFYNVFGAPIVRTQRVNNVDNGYYKRFYYDGSPNIIASAINNQFDGKYTTYYPNGKVDEEGNYLNGNKHGIWKNYNEAGTLVSQEVYHLDMNIDSTVYFHYNGKPDVVINYRNDEKHGFTTRYAPTGEIIYRIMYENGTIIYYTYLGADGKFVAPIYFKNGAGKMITKYPNGKPAAEIEYEASLIHGTNKIFYPNGQMMKQEERVYGETNGPYVFYYPNGNKEIEATYQYDVLDGKYTRYNENGTLSLEEEYKDGKHIGTSKFYDLSGKLTHLVTYQNGIITKIEKK